MKILFIGMQDIFGDIYNGGSQCSQKNFILLSSISTKDNIYTALVWNKEKKDYRHRYFRRVRNNAEALWASIFGCRNYLPYEERKIVSYIDEIQPDIIYLDTSLLGKILKKTNQKTIVFFHNIEADYAWNKVKKKGIGYLPAYWASKYNEKCAMKADRIICLNKRDSVRMEQLYGRRADLLLPITFKDTFDVNKTTSNYKKEILFLGSLFQPNIISIEWFIKEVMPKLQDIILNIVGKDFEKKKEEYEKNKNVKVIGTVDETAPYYYAHAAVVLPIRYGAGMKVKTAEAMMYGRWIFASDEALEGYEVDDVEGIVRCNTVEEYVESINQYYEAGKFQNYQKTVRKVFKENYETMCVEQRLSELIENLGNDK